MHYVAADVKNAAVQRPRTRGEYMPLPISITIINGSHDFTCLTSSCGGFSGIRKPVWNFTISLRVQNVTPKLHKVMQVVGELALLFIIIYCMLHAHTLL